MGKYVTLKEAESQYGISKTLFYKFNFNKTLPFIKVGLYKKYDLDMLTKIESIKSDDSMENNTKLLDIMESSTRLQICPVTLRNWTKNNIITPVKICRGHKHFYDVKDIEYLSKNKPFLRESIRFVNLIGERFNMLTIIKREPNRNGQARWLCRCDCDNEVNLGTHSLTSGAAISCGHHKRKQDVDYRIKNYNDLTRKYWTTVKGGATKRKLEFQITMQQGWEQIEKQKFICSLSGELIYLRKDYAKNWKLQTASLDRIDSSKGYILDNIQWVHKEMNLSKWHFQQDYFIYLCSMVACPNNSNEFNIENHFYDPEAATENTINDSLWVTIKNGAKSRKLNLHVTKDDIWNKFVQQRGKCSLTGINLILAKRNKNNKFRTASLDRIDSTKGYISNNIQWVHRDINMMKRNLKQTHFIDWCKKVASHNS